MDSRKLGLCVGLFAAAGSASAADQPAGAPQEQLTEVVVTGSVIPTAPDAVAVPVETLTSDQLQASGVNSNALEILRKEIPAFQGRSNAGTSNANNNNQNTAGGSQVQLRNLPTLVLVDGRRVATSGIGAINGKNFVDVNQIPSAAIDHVDVLTDGASSIYGSDAVGGVVNFILRSDYEGFSAGARAADAKDYGEWSAFATGGLPMGGGHITMVASVGHTDPLFQNDRPFSSPLYGKTSGLPGTVNGANDILSSGLSSPSAKNPTGVNATAGNLAALVANGTYTPTSPAAVAAAFDISPYQTLLLKQDLASFVSTFDLPIADRGDLMLFGDFMLSNDKSWTQWFPVTATGNTVPVDAPYNPLTTAFPGVTFNYLAAPHDFYDTTTALRVTLGLRGELGRGWTWDSALVWSDSSLQQHQTNVIFKPNLALAIAGGYNAAGQPVLGGPFSQVYNGYSTAAPYTIQPALDPFATAAGLNPGSLANVYGTELIDASSLLESWDGKIVGRVPGLPAGQIGIAVGATIRRESLSGHTDPNGRVTDALTGAYGVNSQFWVGGTFSNPFIASRTISGAFAEVRVPVTSEEWNLPAVREFDLTFAMRSEHYSDVGNSNVPKVGFRWRPFDKQLTFRGNYAKSFLAPNLFSETGPTDTRTVAGTVIQGVFGANYAAMPFNGEDGNNPNLKPATSISRTLGFVFKPEFVKNLTVTADYSHILLQGFQAGIGFNNILSSVNTLGAASPYAANLAINAFPGLAGSANPFATQGALLTYLTNPVTGKGDPTKAANLYLIDRFQNNAELLEESWIVAVNYEIPTEHAGTFDLGTTGSIFDSFAFQGLPGQAFIQYSGNATNAGVFGGTLPKYHFYTTLQWTRGDLNVSVANTYLSAVTDTGPNGNLAPLPVSRYFAWDLRAAYDWHKLKAAVGVNNVQNRRPPLAPRTFTDNNADVATYSPIGRLVYATVTANF